MKIGVLILVLLFASACGNDPAGGHQHGAGGHADAASTAGFGSAGDASDADRTIEVAAVDPLKFQPASLEVELGETVTFEVRNEGSTDHEFVLGDAAYQEAHGPQMGAMEHSEGNGIFLEPGASDTVTWTFDEAGEVLFACHVDGHFEAGMFGRIRVR